ncbi:hypothetical protein [Selenomonas sp. oral taxon 892]|nr:hypothetical protein [Selenomonas sp. oral taxon 892]
MDERAGLLGVGAEDGEAARQVRIAANRQRGPHNSLPFFFSAVL